MSAADSETEADKLAILSAQTAEAAYTAALNLRGEQSSDGFTVRRFKTRPGGVNALVTLGCFDSDTQEHLFAKVAPISPSEQDSIIVDGFNSQYIYDLNKNGPYSKHIMQLRDVQYVNCKRRRGDKEHQCSTTSKQCKKMALIYACTKGGTMSDQYKIMVSRSDIGKCVSNFVDFLKHNATRYGMMHNDLHSGNAMYDTETNTLTLIDYGRVSLFTGIEDELPQLADSSVGTPLELRTYNMYASFLWSALPPMRYAEASRDPDHPLVKFRYIPDLMNFSMHLYTSILEHAAGPPLPFFRKLDNVNTREDEQDGRIDGLFVGDVSAFDADLNVPIPQTASIYAPIMEGLIAYAAYTRHMKTAHDHRKCFFNYTPVARSFARTSMAQFLEEEWSRKTPVVARPPVSRAPTGVTTRSRAKNARLAPTTDADPRSTKRWRAHGRGSSWTDDVDDVDDPLVNVSVLFPTSLPDAYSERWRSVRYDVDDSDDSDVVDELDAYHTTANRVTDRSLSREAIDQILPRESPIHGRRDMMYTPYPIAVGAGDPSHTSRDHYIGLNTVLLLGTTVAMVALGSFWTA